MTLLKDNNYRDINIALLSLENDIKKLSNFDTSAIDKQLVEINERIDKINAGSNSSSGDVDNVDNSAEINDIRAEIENINSEIDAIRGGIGNTLNCYDTTMTGLGFTNNQDVSVSEFAQALINYTGTTRGQVHFTWLDAGRAYIKATTPYNTQLEISGGTVTFNSQSHNVSAHWNTFDAQYINRLGEVFTFGIQRSDTTTIESVRKEVDTSGKVATAETADTAGTADAAKGWKEYTLNLKGLPNSNFYPVVIDTGYKFVDVEIRSEDGGGYLPYNQNRIKFTISAAGWTDTPKSLFISEYNRYEANEVTIGCIGYCNEDAAQAVIWLRGGLWYTCYTMNCPSAPAVKTVDTALDTSIVTVGTSYSGGTNTKVSILFTPDSTMSSGIYSSAGMTTAGNLAIKKTIGVSLSSFGQEPLSIGASGTYNMGIDENVIQARYNGEAAGLYLNHYGGLVSVNGQGRANGGLNVRGHLNIPTSAPSNPEKGDIWLVL